MSKIKVITDSCADLSKEYRDMYDIDYVKMNTVYEGKETPASLDWEYYSPKELYDIMRAGNRVFTNQVPYEEFEKVFSNYLSEGYDIIYISCSQKQSASIVTGEMVANDLKEKFPNGKIYCIDSLGATMAEGLVAIMCAKYVQAGLDIESVVEKVKAERKTVNEFATVHNLDCLKRCGRVKASSAFFGNLFGVKPILIADAEGYQTPIKKVKGRTESMVEIVNLLKEAIVNPQDQTIFINHADCIEDAEFVKSKILELIPCKDVYINYIGPIVGASVGPSTVSVFAIGKEVTYTKE